MRVCVGLGLTLVTCSLIFSGCGGPPPVGWDTLERLNYNVVEAEPGLRIPAKHLYELIYFSRVSSVGGPVSDSVIQAFRDSVTVDTLIGLTVDEFELGKHWYQYREYRDRTNAALEHLFWTNQVGSTIAIDSQEVIDYYHSHAEEFSLPEQVNIYHILSSPLGFRQGRDSLLVARFTREDLDAFAEVFVHRLYQLLEYGEPFQNVAFNFSHDVMSREKGGHLGWTRRGVYVDPFDSIAFSLQDGEYSVPYKDADGWHMLYRAAYNPGGPQPLDSSWVYTRAYNAVFNIKGSGRANRIVDSLRSAAVFEYNDLLLTDTIVHLVADSVWAAVVNKTDTVDFFRLKGLEDDYRKSYQVSNTTPDMRRLMVMHAAGPLIIVQAARSLGLDTLPNHRATERQVWRETVKALRLALLYNPDTWAPSDSAVAQYYQEHYHVFNPPLFIRAEQLLVQEEELAHFLREQIQSGFTLPYLAEYYGREEGYSVIYENMGVVKEGSVDPVLFDALRRTHASRVTKVVRTPRGYHIARVLEREYPQSLDMAAGAIRSLLIEQYRRQKWFDFRDELFRKQQVRFPGVLPPFELPRLSQRNHPRTLPRPSSDSYF
ncbi:MAG: peptidylprolyl isomerase [Candidatus Zixiibacteriota bacterium]